LGCSAGFCCTGRMALELRCAAVDRVACRRCSASVRCGAPATAGRPPVRRRWAPASGRGFSWHGGRCCP
jgi:hypothetical protein